jgi:hypothetical protein
MEHKDVKNQEHYTAQTVQPIEYMEITMTPEQFEGYLLGNVIKYISRYRHKNGMEDLRKAKVYIGWLVDHVADTGNNDNELYYYSCKPEMVITVVRNNSGDDSDE